MQKKEITTTELFEAISAFSEQCVTKDYLHKTLNEALKPFATKEDIKPFATKADLKLFATKEDLKSFATKADLRGVKEDIGQVKEDLRGVKGDTQKILQLFPSLVHKEDRKVNTLVERLVAKHVFARSEVADILDTHPLVP